MVLASFGRFPLVLAYFGAGVASFDGNDLCGQQPMERVSVHGDLICSREVTAKKGDAFSKFWHVSLGSGLVWSWCG